MRVLVLVDLVQDIDVLLPVLLALAPDSRIRLRIAVCRWLATRSPRTAALLRSNGLTFSWVRRSEVIEGRAPSLRHIDALLTASESDHPAHAAAWALATRCRSLGVRSYTLQHGLENVGLAPGAGDHRFASDVVFTWSEQARDGLPAETRAKLHPIGRPAPPPSRDLPSFDVGVFENLHAERYAAADRDRFLTGLQALQATGASILLKPHPAGRWISDAMPQRARNVTLATEVSGREAVASVRRVITTPSTIVLDAAALDRPVGLAADGEGLFTGFPVLSGPQAWCAFAASQVDDQAEARRRLLDAAVLAGDAGARLVAVLAKDASRLRAKKHLASQE